MYDYNMNPNDFITESENISEARNKALQERTERQNHEKELAQVLDTVSSVGSQVSEAIKKKSNQVEVTNFPTSVKTPDIERLVIEIKALKDKVSSKAEDSKTHALLNNLEQAIKSIVIPEAKDVQFPKTFSINNLKDYEKKIDAVIEAVKAIQINVEPQITVKPADVKIKETDFSKLENKLDILTSAVKAISIVVPEQDDRELLKRISATTKAINSLSFPVPNYVLPFKKADGSATQALVDDDGMLLSQSTLDKYALYATEYGATYNYIMKYQRGTTNWEIQRETISTGVREYAGGTTALATGWAGRASESYGGAV